MTRETIEVQDFEERKDKNNNRYLRVKTDKGWMSCFKSKEMPKIRDKEKQRISVETSTAGKFTNIESVYGDADPQTDDEGEVQVEKVSQNGLQEQYKVVQTDRIDRAKALELAIKAIQGKEVSSAEFTVIRDSYFNYITKGE
jgi:hypothetical protein